MKYDAYNLKTKQDCQKVLSQLKSDFRSKNYVEIAKSKLHHLKQEPYEDVVVFAQRAKDLVEDAYSGSSPETIGQINCETFIRGLKTDLRIATMKKREYSFTFNDVLKIGEKQHILEITKREKGERGFEMINSITSAFNKLALNDSPHIRDAFQNLSLDDSRRITDAFQNLNLNDSPDIADALKKLSSNNSPRGYKQRSLPS